MVQPKGAYVIASPGGQADYEPTVLGAMTESSFAAMGTY